MLDKDEVLEGSLTGLELELVGYQKELDWELGARSVATGEGTHVAGLKGLDEVEVDT